jgi:DNA (cytosine-5)-methyltransferase 1
MTDYHVLDLFCGAGGASCGIDMAGFDLVAAVDTDTDALDTHAANLPGYTVRHDLSDVDPSILPERAQSPVYIHGSPPCKGFSTANDDRHIDDERNALVSNFIDWVAELQPAVVTMENVTGMLTISTEFMGRVEAAFRDAGYRVKYRTLNAADYGVPQTRKRVITVGIRKDIDPPSRWVPKPTHAETATTTLDGRELDEWVTVAEAIGDLAGTVETTTQDVTSDARWRGGDEPSGTVGTNGAEYARSDGGVANRVPPDHSDEVRERLAEAESGAVPHPAYAKPDWDQPAFALVGGHQAAPILPDGVPSTNDGPTNAVVGEFKTGAGEGFGSWKPATEPSSTVNTEGIKQRVNEEIRRLTVRECARLQSFPDWFVFRGSKTSQYAQLSNAVPPLLQYHIARHLRTTVLKRAEVMQ